MESDYYISLVIITEQVHAQITIYVPVPTDLALQQAPGFAQPEILGVSALGIASDGATQYEATEVVTAFVNGESTIPFLKPATLIRKSELIPTHISNFPS